MGHELDLGHVGGNFLHGESFVFLTKPTVLQKTTVNSLPNCNTVTRLCTSALPFKVVSALLFFLFGLTTKTQVQHFEEKLKNPPSKKNCFQPYLLFVQILFLQVGLNFFTIFKYYEFRLHGLHIVQTKQIRNKNTA